MVESDRAPEQFPFPISYFPLASRFLLRVRSVIESRYSWRPHIRTSPRKYNNGGGAFLDRNQPTLRIWVRRGRKTRTRSDWLS